MPSTPTDAHAAKDISPAEEESAVEPTTLTADDEPSDEINARDIVAAKYAKNNFGAVIDEARRGPMVITKNGRPSVAIIDIELYQYLQDEMEDYYLGLRSNEAIANGNFLSPEETKKLFEDLINAKS